jgi:hypothetical protein
MTGRRAQEYSRTGCRDSLTVNRRNAVCSVPGRAVSWNTSQGPAKSMTFAPSVTTIATGIAWLAGGRSAGAALNAIGFNSTAMGKLKTIARRCMRLPRSKCAGADSHCRQWFKSPGRYVLHQCNIASGGRGRWSPIDQQSNPCDQAAVSRLNRGQYWHRWIAVIQRSPGESPSVGDEV